MKNNQPRIALVHDYLREYGGAERVLEALHSLYPDAPVFTAFIDKHSMGIHWQRFSDWNLQTTWMQKIPGITKFFSPLRVLAPSAFRALDLSTFDVVISSSNAYFAKAVKVPNGVHICYCHTPPRALYGYSTMSDWKSRKLTRYGGAILNHFLRIFDFKMAQEVDLFIANSCETARRIRKFYRRDSTVVHPPVGLVEQAQAATQSSAQREYFLYVNRLAYAKHPELAVAVCTKLELPLIVVGEGVIRPELEAQAGPTVTFKGAVDDTELRTLYAGAAALLYPVEDEDFGIVPIEALASGTPVIAHASGGPLETLTDGETGILFSELTEEGLEKAVARFKQTTWKQEKLRAAAQRYLLSTFKDGITKVVATAQRRPQNHDLLRSARS